MKTTIHYRQIITFILLALFSAALPVISQTAPTPVPGPQKADGPAWDGTLRRIRVPILMYHYVSPLPDGADRYRVDLTVSPDQFRAHLDYLFHEGYTPISMYELDNALMTGAALPAEPVILTFDDGYIDHYTEVFPALKSRNFRATFFVITGRADNNDSNYLSWAQIEEMAAAGMDMEGHTKTHNGLQERDYETQVYEMLGSIESLNAYTGRQTHMFSYPGGDYDALTLSIANSLPIWRAVTTRNGYFHTTDNRLLLDRVRIPGGLGAQGLASILNDDGR